MPKKRLNVLIIEDHPIIIEGYKNALLSDESSNEYDYFFRQASNCDDALKTLKLKSAANTNLVLLDIKLPPSQKNHHVTSGEDLAIHIRRNFPDTKIIILTMLSEQERIINISKSIEPDGFIIKSDLTSKVLKTAFHKVFNDPPFYSESVLKIHKMNNNASVLIDQIDRSILYHLSKGVKTKNLVDYIPLSLSAIEKRKLNLKKVLELKEKNDKSLISKALEKGFI
ncbi:response regulator [Aureivirga marina]|uniref:response regulator n=1 Tax=Aureivirga marina TaxID=1182451 RepID=UPI0018CBAD73|nr:response regulator [Aureivirga marina]